MQALVQRGVPISRVRDLLDASPGAAGALPPQGPWRGYQERMIAAISQFDERELDQVHDEALSIHPIEKITRNMILPLLVRLGEHWQNLPGAIAEEHFFAMYLRSKLGARLQHRMRYATGPLIVAACAPGEQHEIGLLLFALEAHQAGLQTVLLGADTPLEDVVIAQRRSGGDAVVISSSVAPAAGFLERALPALVHQVDVPVFVGGVTALGHPLLALHPAHRYGHDSLVVQLEFHGVRALELDLHKAGDGRFEVYHIRMLDSRTHCRAFESCLGQIRAWMDAHPRHEPLLIWIEAKDFAGGERIASLREVDPIIRRVLGDRVLAPDDVRGGIRRCARR